METMHGHIRARLVSQDSYFAFNRYRLYSIKRFNQKNMRQNIANYHYSPLSAPLPGGEKVLSSLSNKTQLIDIIADFVSHKVVANRFLYLLSITASQDTPIEISAGNIIHRDDLATTHNEADVNIVQLYYKLIEKGLLQ